MDGIKQSPSLFSLTLEYPIRQIDSEKEHLLTNKSVQLAAWADDVAHYEHKMPTHKKKDELARQVQKYLPKKTEVLAQTRTVRPARRITSRRLISSHTQGVKICTHGTKNLEPTPTNKDEKLLNELHLMPEKHWSR